MQACVPKNLGLSVRECASVGDAGVVDENVDASERFAYGRHRIPHLLPVRDVAGQGQSLDARARKLLACHPERARRQVDNRDLGAGPSKASRERASDPPSATRYDDAGSIEVTPNQEDLVHGCNPSHRKPTTHHTAVSRLDPCNPPGAT